MGLAISVNMLSQFSPGGEEFEYFEREFANLNADLESNGYPTYKEPSDAIPSWADGACTSFPYSFLHYLRRAYVFSRLGREIPSGDLTDAEQSEITEFSIDYMEVQLTSHSDCDGFYVPIESDFPILAEKATGGLIGSSHALLRELVEVAPALGIGLVDGELTDEGRKNVVAANAGETEVTPHYREYIVWYCLFQAARASIAHQTAIVFH